MTTLYLYLSFKLLKLLHPTFLFSFLQVQGLIISQMLRKSVETRDWVNTIEPRNVRAVMKRVVEDTTSIDVQVTPASDYLNPSCTHKLIVLSLAMCLEDIFSDASITYAPSGGSFI